MRDHVIDGEFGVGEWNGVIPLEGMYTDLYMDFQGGRMYILNDWRLNQEGIPPECYNLFTLRIGGAVVRVRVYGDGHMVVTGAEIVGEGAYSFSSSPRWNVPHTIWEFQLALSNPGDICLKAHDPPGNSSDCEDLTFEPVTFAIRTGTGQIQVARVPDPGVTRLGEGSACGTGEGICQDGLSCVEEGGSATCVEQDTPGPDGDMDAVSDAPTDVTDEVPADVPDAASDVDFPDEPSPDAADPDGYGEDGPS